MVMWQEQLRNSITTIEQLEKYINISESEKKEIKLAIDNSAFGITPYYASLMDKDDRNCPIRKQAVPSIEETKIRFGTEDPIMEKNCSPCNLVIHVYPDRVAFLVSGSCAMYCRHCLRKHTIKKHSTNYGKEELKKAIEYIANSENIRDVLLTGGDPLLLSDAELEWIISQLRSIKHVEIIRIGTRTLCTLPQRFTDDLCNMLSKYHPIWLNTQFNHPKELTDEVEQAVDKILRAGIPVGNQTVLLKGINDDVETMKKLLQKLVCFRIRPYYIYQAQTLSGTEHFITPIEDGINIIRNIRGYTSGICEPKYVLDTPYGKVPLNPTYLLGREGDYVSMRTWDDEIWKEYNPVEELKRV